MLYIKIKLLDNSTYFTWYWLGKKFCLAAAIPFERFSILYLNKRMKSESDRIRLDHYVIFQTSAFIDALITDRFCVFYLKKSWMHIFQFEEEDAALNKAITLSLEDVYKKKMENCSVSEVCCRQFLKHC